MMPQNTNVDVNQDPAQILKQLMNARMAMLGPYQKGVNKKLEEAGSTHVAEALQQGVDPRQIQSQAGLDHPAMDAQQQPQSQMQQQQPQMQQPGQQRQSMNPLQLLHNLVQGVVDIIPTSPEAKTANAKVALNQQLLANGGLSSAQQVQQMNYEDKKKNAKSIADAIESGDQMADFKSLYGLAGPVKAELERRGVNVADLQKQAIAETKLAQTLNGPQQTRLRQSIDSTLQGLDELDSLNQEFQRTGIKSFNKAQIEALKNGAGTPEQQDIAQRFVTQMTGLQDEFGNVVMGGNSVTDKVLALSGKIFNSDYNNTTVTATTKQARRLLKMRKDAIENVGVAGGGKKEESQTPSSGNKVGRFTIEVQ